MKWVHIADMLHLSVANQFILNVPQLEPVMMTLLMPVVCRCIVDSTALPWEFISAGCQLPSDLSYCLFSVCLFKACQCCIHDQLLLLCTFPICAGTGRLCKWQNLHRLSARGKNKPRRGSLFLAGSHTLQLQTWRRTNSETNLCPSNHLCSGHFTSLICAISSEVSGPLDCNITEKDKRHEANEDLKE